MFLEAMLENSRIPLYQQIYDLLREKIDTGVFLPKTQIPTEAELSQEYEVSSITVKQAIQKLVAEGLLYRKQGKGTFVCSPRVNRKLNRLISFNAEMLQKGMVPSTKVLDVHEAVPRKSVAEALQLPGDSRTIVVKRLRMADDEPLAIQTSHIPQWLCPTLVDKRDALGGSLYGLLLEEYGLVTSSGRESYSAVIISGPDARLLEVPDGSPAFAVQRLAFLPDGRPVEFVHSVLRGDRYSLDVELQAPDPTVSGW